MNDKLLKIQSELKAPKNQKNMFGGYNYRSCEDIFEAVKPLLKEEGLILRLTDELVNIGERYYIKATAILTDGTDTIENVAYAREEETKKGMDGSQITGASSSYARKYALNGLFLIDDVKDSDTTNVGEITTEEEALEYKLTFGKFKGQTLKEVSEQNEWYIESYLLANGDDTIKSALKLMGYEEETEEDIKNMPIQETQKSRIRDEVDRETIKLFIQSVGKEKLSDLTYEEANKLLGD